MIFEPERRVPLPEQDLLSYIFNDPKTYDPNEPVCASLYPVRRWHTDNFLQIYVDTKDQTQTVSFNQARTIIRRLITGLRAAGVQVNDCVAVHAFNNVSPNLDSS